MYKCMFQFALFFTQFFLQICSIFSITYNQKLYTIKFDQNISDSFEPTNFYYTQIILGPISYINIKLGNHKVTQKGIYICVLYYIQKVEQIVIIICNCPID